MFKKEDIKNMQFCCFNSAISLKGFIDANFRAEYRIQFPKFEDLDIALSVVYETCCRACFSSANFKLSCRTNSVIRYGVGTATLEIQQSARPSTATCIEFAHLKGIQIN